MNRIGKLSGRMRRLLMGRLGELCLVPVLRERADNNVHACVRAMSTLSGARVFDRYSLVLLSSLQLFQLSSYSSELLPVPNRPVTHDKSLISEVSRPVGLAALLGKCSGGRKAGDKAASSPASQRTQHEHEHEKHLHPLQTAASHHLTTHLPYLSNAQFATPPLLHLLTLLLYYIFPRSSPSPHSKPCICPSRAPPSSREPFSPAQPAAALSSDPHPSDPSPPTPPLSPLLAPRRLLSSAPPPAATSQPPCLTRASTT